MIWASLVLSVLGLAGLSASFDYGRSFYPSQEHPYFTSGRLILGALVPFLILYVEGLAFLLRPLSRKVLPIVAVAVVCLMVTVSEVELTWPIAGNAYNWFHIGNH
jgi:hypothetical protein